MSAQSMLALRYAQAFLNVYASTINHDDFLNMVALYNHLLQDDQTLIILSSYKLSEAATETSVDMLIKKFKLVPAFKNLLRILLEKKRIMLFLDVLKFIIWQYQLKQQVLYFEIESAGHLEQSSLQTIKNFLKKLSGNDIIYTYKVNESLIAGVRAKNAYFLWEDSIKSRLQRIKLLTGPGV